MGIEIINDIEYEICPYCNGKVKITYLPMHNWRDYAVRIFMSIIDFIKNMTWQYVSILILFSLYYGIREVMVRNRFPEDDEKNGKANPFIWKRVTFYYFSDFLSQVIFTISSFIALFIANDVFSKLKSFNDISAGTALLLIFLIIWGITGASGYLQYLIVSGKFRGK